MEFRDGSVTVSVTACGHVHQRVNATGETVCMPYARVENGLGDLEPRMRLQLQAAVRRALTDLARQDAATSSDAPTERDAALVLVERGTPWTIDDDEWFDRNADAASRVRDPFRGELEAMAATPGRDEALMRVNELLARLGGTTHVVRIGVLALTETLRVRVPVVEPRGGGPTLVPATSVADALEVLSLEEAHFRAQVELTLLGVGDGAM
jgi:hypothetical protein